MMPAWTTALLGAALLLPPLYYAAAMLRFWRSWQQLPSAVSSSEFPIQAGLQISVLVAARNEAQHLPHVLQDLLQQTLPAAQFEVLVVDDHSTDATAAVVQQWAAASSLQVRLLRLAEVPGAPTGKKAAIAAAIAQARAPWVVCTDADCRLPAHWLQLHAQAAANPATHLVSGPVCLTGSGWLARLQALEMAGLVGVGAAGIGRQQPTMCNGANLGYRRQTFAAVGGFADNLHLASGDDEFLLHKMQQQYPGSIRFLKHEQAVVSTAAQPTVAALLRQRVRWASKWPHYQTAAPQRLAVLVLLANLSLLAGAALTLAWPALVPWVVAAWVLKLGADVLFLRPVLRLLRRPGLLRWVLPLQLLYAPYALAVALLARRGGYSWKGREVK